MQNNRVWNSRIYSLGNYYRDVRKTMWISYLFTIINEVEIWHNYVSIESDYLKFHYWNICMIEV